MKKLGLAIIAAAMVGLFAGAASAQVGKGLSGPHWQIQIIGVSNPKDVDMTNGNRRTIFVNLESPKVKIYYVINTENPDKFDVLDGNATDGEATIAVPYEYCSTLTNGCEDLLSFDVYAVGLGKPDGYAIVTPYCSYSELVVGGGDCTDTLQLGEFTIRRTNGGSNKPKRENITDAFRATGCLDIIVDGACGPGDLKFRDVWVFNIPQLLEYYWDYDNKGLRLMQVRFYETTSGCITSDPTTGLSCD